MERFVGATWTFLWTLLLSLWLWWHLGLLEMLVPFCFLLLFDPWHFWGVLGTLWPLGFLELGHLRHWKYDSLAGHSPGTFVAPWKIFFKGPETFWMLMIPKSMWPVTFGNPGTFFGSWNAFWLLKVLVLWLFWGPETLELLRFWGLFISPPSQKKDLWWWDFWRSCCS